MDGLNSGNQKILSAIFEIPPRSDVNFDDVLTLVKALGAKVSTKGKSSGSRYGILLQDKMITIHRPHPGKVMDKGALKSLKDFLEQVGVTNG